MRRFSGCMVFLGCRLPRPLIVQRMHPFLRRPICWYSSNPGVRLLSGSVPAGWISTNAVPKGGLGPIQGRGSAQAGSSTLGGRFSRRIRRSKPMSSKEAISSQERQLAWCRASAKSRSERRPGTVWSWQGRSSSVRLSRSSKTVHCAEPQIPIGSLSFTGSASRRAIPLGSWLSRPSRIGPMNSMV